MVQIVVDVVVPDLITNDNNSDMKIFENWNFTIRNLNAEYANFDLSDAFYFNFDCKLIK